MSSTVACVLCDSTEKRFVIDGSATLANVDIVWMD